MSTSVASLMLQSKMFQKELLEVERLVKKYARKVQVEENFTRFRLGVPQTRKLIKNHFSFSDDALTRKLRVWDYVWKNSLCYEAMSLCIYVYQSREISKDEFNTLRTWVNRCYCWEHSDDLSKIYADIVEKNPTWILPSLAKWNRSKSIWKRRQSVVSLLEYASKRSRFLPFVKLISFVDPLLEDSEYYVQKGVGWTIREIYNVYPIETLEYLEKNILRIQPAAYSSATEKLNKTIKSKFNGIRKDNRGRTIG